MISADGTRWTEAEAPDAPAHRGAMLQLADGSLLMIAATETCTDGDCYADPALTVSQGTNVAPAP